MLGWVFSCFRNPPNFDMDYRIFNVLTWSFYMIILKHDYTHRGWAHQQWVSTTCLTRNNSHKFVLCSWRSSNSGRWCHKTLSPMLYQLSHPLTPDLTMKTKNEFMEEFPPCSSSVPSSCPPQRCCLHHLGTNWKNTVILFLWLNKFVVCLLKAYIGLSTAQGHLRAFHKFKSYTCRITRHLTFKKTIHKNKQTKSKNCTFGIALFYNSNKAGTSWYRWPLKSLIYQYQFTKTCKNSSTNIIRKSKKIHV